MFPPTELNLSLFEQGIASDNKFVMLADKLEGGVVVLTTEAEAILIPPGWLHATLSITGGLSPSLSFSSSKSLETSANLLVRDANVSGSVSEVHAKAILESLIMALGSSETRQAQERLCKLYLQLSSAKTLPAFKALHEMIGQQCPLCEEDWDHHT